MFGSLVGLVGDVVKVAAAPMSIAIDVARSATKPLADAAHDAAKDVKYSLHPEDARRK
ncbi:hypothetical protein D3C78_903920 [compost metagenome]